MEKYMIVKDVLKKIRRFGLTGRTLEFKLQQVPSDTEPVGWVKSAIEAVVRRGIEGLEPTDQVGINFCSKDFTCGEGWMKFRPASEVSYEDVWNVIASIYQSNSPGFNTDTFCLGVTSVKMPTGRGRGKNYNSFNEECIRRRGIITINNKDNNCLPRAIVTAIAHATEDAEYNKVRHDYGKLQTQRANKLIHDAKLTIPPEGSGIQELQNLQKHLTEYKIIVYTYGTKGRDVIFEGSSDSNKKLNILYHEGHYNVITSLTAAFCCSYYCEICHIPYNNKDRHRCGGTCVGCQQSPACPNDHPKTNCILCCRSFRGIQCYENHLKNNICTKIRRCEVCLKTVKSDRKHVCNEIYCKTCRTFQNHDHLCYMPVDASSPQTKDLIFIFYDLETRQEKVQEDGSRLHEPNLCVFQQRCHNCIQELRLYFCQTCGFRQKIIREDVIPQLMSCILNIRKKFKNVVVIGHNGGGFDHQFILNYILTQTDLTPELTMRGTRLILMKVGNVKFLDSLNYFPMALSKLPETFGLEELKKGYFPHLFNTLANQQYIGPIPAIDFYNPENLKPKERKALIEWHAEQKNYVFDFPKEFEEYCRSDVDILTKSCLKFRQLLLDSGNVCPFTEASTLPSACNKIFRRNFLKPDTIGLIPKGGYRWRNNQSRIATQWLLWEERQRRINIIYSAKQQEATVSGVKVDGFCEETNQVFEFQGCYFHGCSKCFKYNRDQPTHDDPTDTMEYRYNVSTSKIERLRSGGYEVVEKWECDFRRELQCDKDMRLYVENHPILVNQPLNPRDAFYGGRTGNVKTHYTPTTGEMIKYVDICSLYPYVNKYCKYPVGHPEVYVGNECKNLDLHDISGMIKCKILPPEELFHPVLPLKMNDKLMFMLCRSCGKDFSRTRCNHGEEERALTGTWVLDEVLKALEKGYKIMVIYEVWKYQTEQYDPENKVGGLFNEYISKFLAIKQQASGWPSGCDTTEQKNKYIKDYFEKEGVRLDPSKMEKNPGLRQVGKAVITSFWGYLGQRENKPRTNVVNEPAELFSMLANPAVEINTITPINENTLLINWEYKEEAYDILPTVNVCLAAYTTAHARLKLYSYLEVLGDRVLYYDTDSVIYISRPNQYEVPIGSFLGEMTDELEGEGPGSYISDFVSGGPKNYAFKMWSHKTSEFIVICKVKGISLTYATSQLVNFDKIKEMVLENNPKPLVTTATQIRRTKEHEIVSVNIKKEYRPHLTKRIFTDDGSSYPYGYKKIKF